MTRHWVTNGSTHPEAVVNPLAAACTVAGYVPDEVHVLANPGVREKVERTTDLLETIVVAFGGDPTIRTTHTEEETDFAAVVEHSRSVVEDADGDDEVAIDVTPGRKFMSAITFQVGMKYEADHVYYLYVVSDELFGRVYPDLPRTATTLYDFTEVF